MCDLARTLAHRALQHCNPNPNQERAETGFWIQDFGFLPNKEDYKGAYYFIDAVKMYSLNDTFVKKQINNNKPF